MNRLLCDTPKVYQVVLRPVVRSCRNFSFKCFFDVKGLNGFLNDLTREKERENDWLGQSQNGSEYERFLLELNLLNSRRKPFGTLPGLDND